MKIPAATHRTLLFLAFLLLAACLGDASWLEANGHAVPVLVQTVATGAAGMLFGLPINSSANAAVTPDTTPEANDKTE